MRISFKLLALALAVPASGALSAQADFAPFELNVSLSEPVIKVGSESRLKIVLRNTTTHELSIAREVAEDAAETQYTIDIRDSQGHPVALTKYGRMRFNKDPDNKFMLSLTVLPVKAGETLTDVAVVSRLYDLSRPGEYEIQVSRPIPNDPRHRVVKSNRIKITIVPSAGPS